MIHLLPQNEYHRVRDLYRAFDFHLSAGAVIEGMNPGKVWVDDPAAPQASLMVSPEGCYLAGRPDHAAFNRAINAALFAGEILGEGGTTPYFVLSSEEWVSALDDICQPRPPIRVARRHYVCRLRKPLPVSLPASGEGLTPSLSPLTVHGKGKGVRSEVFNWRAAVPEGFTVRRIDAALLDQPGLKIPDHIPGWIKNNWGSTEHFLQNGFGFATVCGDEVVCWSLADCVSPAGCEIGIHTAPDYRRRGLAAITAAAAVEHALASGLPLVGWQCNEDNPGSWATAEKVGFTLERRYTMRFICLDEVIHLVEMSYAAMKDGQLQQAVDLSQQALALNEDAPYYVHHMAARAWAASGNADRALASLETTAGKGWPYVGFTESCAEFTILHGSPLWAAMIEQMRRNQENGE